MTKQEIITVIKCNICYKQDICSDGICKSTEGRPCAIDAAIECIEKQISKKPIRSEHSGKCWCPSCNSEDEMDLYGTDFCPDCGQAIDWSENE